MLQNKWWLALGVVAMLGLGMSTPGFDGDCDKEDEESVLLADCSCDGECDGSCGEGDDAEAELLLADCSCDGECDGSCGKDDEAGEAELLADDDCEDDEEESELWA